MSLIILILVVLYIAYRVMSAKTTKQAQNLGVDAQEVKEAVQPEPNVYAQAAKDIGAGALTHAKAALEEGKTTVQSVQRDRKKAQLRALLQDEDLLNELKADVTE